MNQRKGGRYQRIFQRSNIQDRSHQVTYLRTNQRRTTDNESRPCNDAGGQSIDDHAEERQNWDRDYWRASVEGVKVPSKRVRSRDITGTRGRDEGKEEVKRPCVRRAKKESRELARELVKSSRSQRTNRKGKNKIKETGTR